jgi:phenylalanine-4-hydroxylase
VLDQVERGLCYTRGGMHALDAARESDELATVLLDSGAQVSGVVRAVRGARGVPALVELSGRCAIGLDGVVLRGLPQPDGYLQPLGTCSGATTLATLDLAGLARLVDAREQLRIAFDNAIVVSGKLLRPVMAAHGKVVAVLLEHARIVRGDALIAQYEGAHALALGNRVVTAQPGALEGYHPETAFSQQRVPKPSEPNAAQRRLRELYEQALETWRTRTGNEVVSSFEQIAAALEADFTDDWLLRFNLLESLVKLGEGAALKGRLERELEALEIRFAHREPIATGLRYVRALGGAPSESERPGAPR